MSVSEFKPLGIGEILDATFRMYRKHFVRFVTIVAVILVPLGLLEILARAAFPDVPGPQGRMMPNPAANLVVMLITIVASALTQGALFKSISESYMGRDVTVSEAYGFVLPKVLRIIWASILVGVVVMVGFVLCIVPGVIFALWLALTIPVLVVEGTSATNSMKRSRQLVSGNLGKVFGLLFLVWLMNMVVMVLFGFVLGYAAGSMMKLGPNGAIVLVQVGAVIGQILWAPIAAAPLVLLYYDMRIRKEGFDLEMLAQSMGAEAETETMGNVQ